MDNSFVDVEYQNKSGPANNSTVESAKIIGIYFAASWSGPCRTFTPVLIDFYQKINQENKKFEIIFVSYDKDEISYKAHLDTMPWLALSFNHNLAETLTNTYKVFGLPKLVIIDKEINSIILESARADIIDSPDTCFDNWLTMRNKVSGDVWTDIKTGKPVKHTYYIIILEVMNIS
jgi:nucleoredoxin